jgi:hypothetical protein
MHSPFFKSQENIPMCAALAMASIMEATSGSALEASAMFIQQHMQTDTSSSAARAVKRFGVCPEAVWPTDIGRLRLTPPRSVYRLARQWSIKAMVPVTSAKAVTGYLDRGCPSLLSYDVKVFSHLGLNIPELSSPLHVSAILDYLDDRLIVRNSWGSDWNGGGNFSLPSVMIENVHLVKSVLVIIPRGDSGRIKLYG